jgi:hypothetical protein
MERRSPLALATLLLLAPRAFAGAPEAKGKRMNLAFVLLSEAKLPKGEAIERAFASYAGKGQTLRFHPRTPKQADGGGTLEFEMGGGGSALVALMPVPVPNQEADEAARYSVSALGGRWKLPPHKAHLVVTAQGAGTAVEALAAFTSVVAAVVEASPAVGVYFGNAGATHDPKFFRDLAREHDANAQLMLWSGVSIAQAAGGRVELLSLGMKQLELPDLLLVAPAGKGNEALPMLYDLLAYLVSRGAPLPEGDTVGRSATEKLPVHYVTSPVDANAKVWRVEMK